jgi:hypothetical protein
VEVVQSLVYNKGDKRGATSGEMVTEHALQLYHSLQPRNLVNKDKFVAKRTTFNNEHS